MGLVGILLGLALLVWLALRGWSVLLLAPAAALLAAAFAMEPLLASWTQTFMGSAAVFLAQFFPLFLLDALFGDAARGPLHKKSIFCTKSHPLVELYVQSPSRERAARSINQKNG